eukprot:2811885-Prymnesium_polylepis.1
MRGVRRASARGDEMHSTRALRCAHSGGRSDGASESTSPDLLRMTPVRYLASYRTRGDAVVFPCAGGYVRGMDGETVCRQLRQLRALELVTYLTVPRSAGPGQ